MKFSIDTPKPRNRMAVAARQRHAGAHRPSGQALRQRAKHELRSTLQRELRHERPPST